MRKRTMEELNRLTVNEFIQSSKLPFCLVLDNIRSALNIGSIFRTADAFRIQEILLVGISAQPPHREVLKSALGATQTVAWKYFSGPVEAITHIQNQGYKIIPVEQTDTSKKLHSVLPSSDDHFALVLGHEVHGVSEDFLKHSDFSIEIEQHGMKHSLNVAVCAGIVMHYFYEKMKSGLSTE